MYVESSAIFACKLCSIIYNIRIHHYAHLLRSFLRQPRFNLCRRYLCHLAALSFKNKLRQSVNLAFVSLIQRAPLSESRTMMGKNYFPSMKNLSAFRLHTMIYFHHIDIIFLSEAIFHFYLNIRLAWRKEKPIYLFEQKYLTSIRTEETSFC